MVFLRRVATGFLIVPNAYAAAPDGQDLATTFGALLLVIAIIFGLAWMLKRMQVPSIMGAKAGLRVVSQLPLGQKERVVVLDVNGEQVLVGVTAQQITLLKALDNPLPEAEPAKSFSAQFNQIVKKNEAP